MIIKIIDCKGGFMSIENSDTTVRHSVKLPNRMDTLLNSGKLTQGLSSRIICVLDRFEIFFSENRDRLEKLLTEEDMVFLKSAYADIRPHSGWLKNALSKPASFPKHYGASIEHLQKLDVGDLALIEEMVDRMSIR
jgi:hypothetical protein